MSVSLSSINRAALSAKEGYWWINGIALALSLLIAAMSFSAYADAGAPMNAWVCVTCQALAIALAILARRAMTAQMPLAGLAAGVGALGCAWWASHGLALAWSQSGDPANVWMVFFLTALEPALFLLAEHVREGRDAIRVAHERDAAEQAAELARIRERDGNWGPRLAATGGAALVVASPAAASVPAPPPVREPAYETPAIVSTNTGYADPKAHVFALTDANPHLSQVQIARIVGRPRSTVNKWLLDRARDSKRPALGRGVEIKAA